MADTSLIIKKSTLTSIANAVRSKTGLTGPIPVTDIANEIMHINDGGESAPITLRATYNNNTAGNAFGEIVLTSNQSEYSGTYDIFWGDENGIMSNYSKIDTIVLDVVNGKNMGSIKMREFNAIPKYATKIYAVKNNEPICDFNIPNIKKWASGNYGEHLYSVGVLSDVHVQYQTGHDDVRVAMTYLNDRESVDAICIAGDLTQSGTVAHLEEWKTIRDTYADSTPTYSCVGNHEAYNNSSVMATNPSAIREYLDSDWVDETATSFVKIINNDVFIFVSAFDGTYQKNSNTMLTNDTLTWLEGVLEQYRNQRCFLFMHVPPHWETTGIKYNGFGNGNGAYSYDIWGNPVVSNMPKADRTAFLNLLDHYKNVIWFSGHSHIKYEYQKLWDNLNVMRYKNGAKFVHVSSLTVPRDIIDGSVSDYIYAESEGAVMDVYTNVVRVRCRNFVGGKFYGICEYLIDTTPVTIPPNSKTLVSISATKSKVSYYTDESFNTNDVSVIALFSDGSTAQVRDDCAYDASQITISTAGTYTLGIAYTYGDVTATASIQVTSVVRPSVKTLSSIAASKTKTAYVLNEVLDLSDISAIATYSDDTTANISNNDLAFDTSQVDMSTVGAYPIEVAYTEDGVTKTAFVNITVSSAFNPTIVIDATYTGTLSGKNKKIDNPTVTVGSLMGTNYAVAGTSVMYGKDLYYRLLSDTGVSLSQKVGFIGGVCHSYNSVTAPNNFSDYSLTASDWTLLTADATGNALHTDSSNNLISIFLKSSSSSTAQFPLDVDCRIQIGYMP